MPPSALIPRFGPGLALVLAAAFVFGPVPESAAQPVEAAWVQMTGAGAVVRAVTADARCPALSVDRKPLAMGLRADVQPGFAQRVCQVALPPGAKLILLDGRPLPAPVAQPSRILIFGDTGCRLKGAFIQSCNDERAWPFARIARLAAARKPDLVIHVGDYYYREGPCPDDRAGCAGSPYGDQWPTWRAELFDPAQPLLASSPWVFARGNHESCARGGPGWFRLLDSAPQPAVCPAESAPFRVDLGGLSLYVVDSAVADDLNPAPERVAAFAAQLSRLQPDLDRRPGWIVTHRPIWGLTAVARIGPVGPLELAINRTEQVAMRGQPLSAVQMVVSGHIHHFSAYDFGPARPSQLIAGTGGDLGEFADTSRFRTGDRVIDGMTARSFSFARFGYLMLERDGADWLGVFRDLDDRVVARCRLHLRSLSCEPDADGR